MFDALERLLFWFSSFFLQTDADALCQIDHPLNDHTFVTNTGSLLTFFKVVGSRRHIGSKEFDEQSAAMARELAVFFNAGSGGRQHSFLFGFRFDQAGGRASLIETMTPSVRTAMRFGADFKWVFDDRLEALVPYVTDEIAVFGLYTHRAGMTPAELKRAQEDRGKAYEQMLKSGIKLNKNTQMSVMSPPALLVSRHNAALATLEDRVASPGGQVRVMLERMDCHQAGRMMRRFADAEDVSRKWKPQLTSDVKGVVDLPRKGEGPILFPMRLGRQVIVDKARQLFHDAELSRRGRYFYASLVMEIAPQDGETDDDTPDFNALAKELRDDIPWQVHFDLVPNGEKTNQLERTFANIFGAAGDHNKSIKAGWDQISEMKRQGIYVPALRAIFSTWAKTERECVDRAAYLRTKIESWGRTVVTNETGAPNSAFLASIPGYSTSIPAKFLPGPLPAFARMMPAFRPSSIWEAGQVVCHTAEGRAYPINLGSSDQNFWGTLVFAPTGSGKSFFMNMLNTGALFSPGLTELPMITVIDKGPSAKGMVNLAKAMLPPNLAEQVVYLRPTAGDSSFIVNPFDTQLGCDRPLPADHDFCCALLMAMAPNLGDEGGKFVSKVVDVLYDYYSRTSPTGRKWQPSLNPKIHAKLEHIGITYDENKPVRVWAIVDAFFKRGMLNDAAEAQLYAVPTLTDVTTVLGSDPRVSSEYDKATNGKGERIIDIFTRNIIAAQQQYSLFVGASRFKGSERVMVIDTAGLAAASQSEEGKRRYGVTLLFARRLGARNFFLDEEEIVDICPPDYAEYHSNRAQKIRSELKFLEYDEIHNARGISAVQELLQKDAREGRKYNIVTVLSSQELDDFPKALVNNSYNFFIMGVGSSTASTELKACFELSDSEIRAIERDCTGPGKFFAMFKTKKGTLSQVLYTKPGPIEKWAFSTTSNDMTLRDALYDEFGVRNTLTFLAREFPSGTARPLIDTLRMNMGEDAPEDGITAAVLAKIKPKLEKFLFEAA